MRTNADDGAGRSMNLDVLTPEERRQIESESAVCALLRKVQGAVYRSAVRVIPEEEARSALFHAVSREILRREGLIRDGVAIVLHHATPQATERYLAGLVVKTVWPSPFSGREQCILNLGNRTGTAPSKSHLFLRANISRKAALHIGRPPSQAEIDDIIQSGLGKLFIERTRDKAVPRCHRRPALVEFIAVVSVRAHFGSRRARPRMVVAASDALATLERPSSDSMPFRRTSLNDSFDAIMRRLRQLSQLAAEVFLLRVRHNLTFKAIAAILRTTAARISRSWTEYVCPTIVGVLSTPADLRWNIAAQLRAIRTTYGDVFNRYVIQKQSIQRIARDLDLSVFDVRRILSNKVLPITFRAIAAQEEMCADLRRRFKAHPSAKALVAIFDADFIRWRNCRDACARAGITQATYRDLVREVIQPAMLSTLR